MRTLRVIEDDENNLLLIRRMPERAGFEAISARTGEAGIVAASSARPDAILLDIRLPDIEGTKVLRRIRAAALSHPRVYQGSG